MATAAAPESAIEAFSVAVIAAARADAAIKAIVARKVFDDVPSDKNRPSPPYVYLGPANIRRLNEGECVTGWEVRLRLFAASVDAGRFKAWALAQAIVTRFDETENLSLAAPFRRIGPVRAVQGGDVIEPVSPKLVFVDLSGVVLRD